VLDEVLRECGDQKTHEVNDVFVGEPARHAIERVCRDQSATYLKGRSLPKDRNLEISPNDGMTEEEIFARLKAIEMMFSPTLVLTKQYLRDSQ
jgi:hypothetical protein